MPTKRTPLKRRSNRRITPEAVAAYRRAEATAAARHECIQGNGCRSADPSGHCPNCSAHRNAHIEMFRLLGIKVWETSPVDAVSAEPPGYMMHNPLQADAWQRAHDLRCELEAAAKAMGH